MAERSTSGHMPGPISKIDYSVLYKPSAPRKCSGSGSISRWIFLYGIFADRTTCWTMCINFLPKFFDLRRLNRNIYFSRLFWRYFGSNHHWWVPLIKRLTSVVIKCTPYRFSWFTTLLWFAGLWANLLFVNCLITFPCVRHDGWVGFDDIEDIGLKRKAWTVQGDMQVNTTSHVPLVKPEVHDLTFLLHKIRLLYVFQEAFIMTLCIIWR